MHTAQEDTGGSEGKQNGSADSPSSTGDEDLESHPGGAMLWDLEALHSY